MAELTTQTSEPLMIFDLNTYLSKIHRQTPPRSRFALAEETYIDNRRRTLVLEAKTARRRKHEQKSMAVRNRFARLLWAIGTRLQSAAERLQSQHA